MYYLLLAFLYPLSLLPLPVLYLLSDAVYGLIYHVLGYRKQIVWDNLRYAFPHKNETELQRVRKAFYKGFCDQWIETIKLLSISKAELNKRVSGNWEVFHQLCAEGKNTYALLGHFFNWEWANVACQWNSPQTFAGVYLPVSSKAFDRLMHRIRSRSGSLLISMKSQKSGFDAIKDKTHIVGLIADQNPSVVENALWLPFMHREAPFFKGPEAMARRAKGAVVFAGIKKERRGYYRITLRKFCDDASLKDREAITRAYVHFLEHSLEAQPPNYLWSHRRWKHKRFV